MALCQRYGLWLMVFPLCGAAGIIFTACLPVLLTLRQCAIPCCWYSWPGLPRGTFWCRCTAIMVCGWRIWHSAWDVRAFYCCGCLARAVVSVTCTPYNSTLPFHARWQGSVPVSASAAQTLVLHGRSARCYATAHLVRSEILLWSRIPPPTLRSAE